VEKTTRGVVQAERCLARRIWSRNSADVLAGANRFIFTVRKRRARAIRLRPRLLPQQGEHLPRDSPHSNTWILCSGS
jgi:hypothetical protein